MCFVQQRSNLRPARSLFLMRDIDAAEIAPLHPNVDVAVVNGDQEVEEV